MNNKSPKTMKTSNRGFSIVELIVVIAIMVVLVAVLAPSFTKYIAEARTSTCSQNRDTLQRELLATYTDDTSLFSDGTITAKQLEKAGLSTDKICSDGGTITVEMQNGSFSVYCSEHESPISFGDEASITSMMSIIAQYCKGTIDSGATVYPESNSAKTMSALKAAGFDFEKLGAVSWKYNSSNKMFYWSTQDISTLKIGDKIPVMKYNPASGNYTVWYATIAQGQTASSSTPYNILSGESDMYPTPVGEQTYENALAAYEKLLKK